MNIAFFTEGGFTGKMTRDNPNRRTEICWYAALDATHHPIWLLSQLQQTAGNYDLGIAIIPKKNINKLSQFPLVENMRRLCKRIAFLQEGPHWFFQDYTLPEQIWYFNTLNEMDFLLCHNEIDVKYYHGLTGKRCYTMPSLMLTDGLKTAVQQEDIVMIGGNMCSWYGGFDSYIVARSMELPIHIPTMGRKIDGEEQLPSLQHLPYMTWKQWITALSEVKYGIHLMRTHAAGTFALNCSWLGIPCIGYRGLDTQELLHEHTTVELGDLERAKELALKLKTDTEFYDMCSKETKENYDAYYAENHFMEHMKHVFETERIGE